MFGRRNPGLLVTECADADAVWFYLYVSRAYIPTSERLVARYAVSKDLFDRVKELCHPSGRLFFFEVGEYRKDFPYLTERMHWNAGIRGSLMAELENVAGSLVLVSGNAVEQDEH